MNEIILHQNAKNPTELLLKGSRKFLY